jgi:hypothetical protein
MRLALPHVFNLITINPKGAMNWVALLLRIQDARGSNTDRRTAVMTQNFRGFFQHLQVNCTVHKITQRTFTFA